MNEMISRASDEIMAINRLQDNIERLLKVGSFNDGFERSMNRVQLQDWLQEILVRMDKVSKLIETNKSLMAENVIGRNGWISLSLWMMEIMPWYNEFEAKIKKI